jgi:hypothetical protein
MLFVSGSKSQHVSEEWVVFHILWASFACSASEMKRYLELRRSQRFI